MPIPNLALTLSVAGAVASSLPSSLKTTTRELDALRERAAEDRAELRRLSAELRTLEQGTDEYNETAQRVQALKDSLAETGVEQRNLVVRQRELQAGTNQTGRALGRMGGVVAGVTGGVIAGIAAITAYSGRLRSLSGLAASTGRDVRSLDREARDLGITLGDPDLGRSALTALAELRQQGRALQADFGAAGIAGIDISALQAGNLELADIQRVLQDIAAEGDTINSAIRRDALAGLVGPDLLAAAQQLNDTSDETLLLRQRLAGASDAALEMRDSVAQGLTPVLTPLLGVVQNISGAIAESSGVTRGFIGTVAVGGAVIGGLVTAVSAAGFVYIGLKNAVDAARGAYVLLHVAETRSAIASRIGAAVTGVRAGVQTVLTGSLFSSVGAWTAATAGEVRNRAVSVVGITVTSARAAAQNVLTGSLFSSVGAWVASSAAAATGTVTTTLGTVATGARAAVQAVLTTSLFASVAGWVAATVAAIGFNVATGGVVLAIGALIAGIILLVKNWDTVQAAVVNFISRFTPMGIYIRGVTAVIRTLGEVAGPVFSRILSAVQPVADVVQGLASGIGRVAGFVGQLFGVGGGGSEDTDEGRRPGTPPAPGAGGAAGMAVSPIPSSVQSQTASMESSRPEQVAPQAVRVELPRPEQVTSQPPSTPVSRPGTEQPRITEITNHFTINGVEDARQVAREVVRILERGETQIVSTRSA